LAGAPVSAFVLNRKHVIYSAYIYDSELLEIAPELFGGKNLLVTTS
jgi:hypothetical protein